MLKMVTSSMLSLVMVVALDAVVLNAGSPVGSTAGVIADDFAVAVVAQF